MENSGQRLKGEGVRPKNFEKQISFDPKCNITLNYLIIQHNICRCVGGKGVQEQCSAGTYQPQPKQTECIPCPAGSYCDAQVFTALQQYLNM